MLNDKLKSKQYYLDKLTMFLKNSYGIQEQVNVLWELLTDIDTSVNDVFTALSMSEIENIDDTLNKLAELVGTKRQLDVSYNVDGVKTYFTLTLNNAELLRAIKTRILQNNYTGTFEEFANNYQRMGLEVLVYDSAGSASVALVLNDSANLTDNDKHLFLSGNYSIRSMGITYEHSIQALSLLAIWDFLNSTYDNSQWGE